jgi:hypothetical protein
VSSAAALALAVYFITRSDEMVDFTGQVRSPFHPLANISTTISPFFHSSTTWLVMSLKSRIRTPTIS